MSAYWKGTQISSLLFGDNEAMVVSRKRVEFPLRIRDIESAKFSHSERLSRTATPLYRKDPVEVVLASD